MTPERRAYERARAIGPAPRHVNDPAETKTAVARAHHAANAAADALLEASKHDPAGYGAVWAALAGDARELARKITAEEMA